MHARTERNGVFDGEPRIERSVAVLEHHLHAAPVRRKIALRCADRIAVEQHVAGVCTIRRKLPPNALPNSGISPVRQRSASDPSCGPS
jgi:hypothetical protein